MASHRPDRTVSELTSAALRDEEDVDLWPVALFLWQRKLIILSVAFVVVLLGVAYVWSRPTMYTAESTVFVNLPQPLGSLGVPPNSLKTVEAFATSPYIVAQVREKVEKHGVPWASDVLRVTEYATAGSQNPVVSMLGLAVDGTNATRAADVAKTWAETLAQSDEQIGQLLKSPLVDFVPKQYAVAVQRLSEAKRAQLDLENRQAAAVAELRSRSNIDLTEARLASLRDEAINLDQQGRALAEELEAAHAEAKAYATELQSIPAALPGTKPDGTRPDSTLPANPVYVQAAGELTKARVRAATIGSEQVETTKRLAVVRTEIDHVQKDLARANHSLQVLHNEQSVANVSADHAVAEAQALVDRLQQQSIDARLAKTETPVEISTGAGANASVTPLSRSTVGPLAVSVIAGMCLGILVAWAKARLDQDPSRA